MYPQLHVHFMQKTALLMDSFTLASISRVTLIIVQSVGYQFMRVWLGMSR